MTEEFLQWGSLEEKMKKGRMLACFACAALVSVSSVELANAAVLVTAGDQLLGIHALDVGGTLYDVDFSDGNCGSLYQGCDQQMDMPFQSVAAATLAAGALSAVSLTGVTSVSGCTVNGVCNVYTPHTLVPEVQTFGILTFLVTGASGAGSTDWGVLLSDGMEHSHFTYAAWTLAPVPLPAALPLLASAFGGLGWVARRRRARS